ncbi:MULTISPECIES: peptide chain release factor N(5)-glutamine methyltransferase [unclassified Corynebacterium]|uniref:peptide chain release factor N(5)-glutamine methyltransferase n=1 Tax=unclassified Corynebacterium TaxID=2624378 RepID=UPI0034CECFA9
MAPGTYARLLRETTRRLSAAGVASPEFDARLLLSHLIGCGHMNIPLNEPTMPGFELALEPLVRRREQREPLQHIVGTAPFGPLDLAVGPGVFIPRPETEVLADWAKGKAEGLIKRGNKSRLTILDLCTGSGALAAYLAFYLAPAARVVAVEKSPQAAEYAARNFAGLGLQVELVEGDACDPGLLPELDGRVDVLVTNPPYVPESPDLAPEVYHDPAEAVFAGSDGMDVIRDMAGNLTRWLAPGGWLGIEHDDATSAAVQSVLRDTGAFSTVEPMLDLTGTARFVRAQRKE